jgi:uncharacterized membrane protein
MKTRSVTETSSQQTPRSVGPSVESGEGVKIETSITIQRPVEQVYSFWRSLENLPRFMRHLKSVTQTTNAVSHWVIETDKGRTLEWDAQIIEEKTNQMISWQSLAEADVENAGSVWFTPTSNGGTMLKVSLKYSPPGGKIGNAIAKLFGDDAEEQIVRDLNQLKTLLESSGNAGASTAGFSA